MTETEELALPPGAPLRALRRELLASLHCALPGTVRRFDPAAQTADILPAVRPRTPAGERVQPPLLEGVPVFFPGGRASGITYPVSPGDECLVIFADSGTDEWYTGGAEEGPPRHHALGDGFALVGFRGRGRALDGFDMSAPRFFGREVRPPAPVMFEVTRNTGTTTGGTFTAFCCGGVCSISGMVNAKKVSANAWTTVGTVPEAYRPAETWYTAAAMHSSDIRAMALCVTPAGEIRFYLTAAQAAGNRYFSITYPGGAPT